MIWPQAAAWFYHRLNSQRHLGVVDPKAQTFFDLGPKDVLAALQTDALQDLTELLQQGNMMNQAPVFDVPVDLPGKIMCLGKNYAAHAAEFGAEVPNEPIFFTKFVDSLLPYGQSIRLPHWIDTRIDHEIELAVILGFADPENRGRKYVSAEEAMDLVAGYTILNDVTARKMQGEDRKAQHPWLRCKSFDTFCPMGPWVLPRQAMPNVNDLDIRLQVNDDLRQQSNTSLMVVGITQAIAYLSKHSTLRCGNIIAMGTPEGVGPLADGDQVVGAIQGIGELHNPVQREAPPL